MNDAVTTELRSRAATLRSLSTNVHPILATTYRRRACEIELALWVHEVRCGQSPDDPSLAA
jgi:hypothetical protein